MVLNTEQSIENQEGIDAKEMQKRRKICWVLLWMLS